MCLGPLELVLGDILLFQSCGNDSRFDIIHERDDVVRQVVSGLCVSIFKCQEPGPSYHLLITGNGKLASLCMFMFIKFGQEKFLGLLSSCIKTDPTLVVR